MGNVLNTFFCTQCDPRKIDVSTQCIQKLVSEEEAIPRGQCCEHVRAKKLRCVDDSHSKQNDLTQQHFDQLVDEIDEKLKRKIVQLPCPNRQAIIMCLEDNPNNILNCKEEMDEFIDCVDAIRITTIKQQIEEEKAKKHKRSV